MNPSTSNPEAGGFETSLVYKEHSRPARPRLTEKPKQNTNIAQRNKQRKQLSKAILFIKSSAPKPKAG